MRNVDNALSTVVTNYKNNSIHYEIIESDRDLWVVNVYNRDAPGSLLQIEIIDDDGIPKCCVMKKLNVGRSSMVKFMNRLMDQLDDNQEV
jgi:hypothetical protein